MTNKGKKQKHTHTDKKIKKQKNKEKVRNIKKHPFFYMLGKNCKSKRCAKN